MSRLWKPIFIIALVVQSLPVASAQEKSVKPGVNDAFRDPDVKEFSGKFEIESREVFARRQEIVARVKKRCQRRSLIMSMTDSKQILNSFR